MSKSIVKKALEMLDEHDDGMKSKNKLNSLKKKKKRSLTIVTEPTKFQDRKQLARTCLTLKKLSKPVVTSDQIEQINNYRFGGPSKRTLKEKKKTEEKEIFTEEDFKRFEREYNPPLQKS
ncbi:unnamed protein product [Adineta ricciae]|uniref:Active regulator of SIRT1 n=2 Tax=Adineta ricciae TaxID=249248 RepID=A0A813U8H7_ADIRI|nr:unnamed protein product [Adineta ricciae]